MKTKKKTMAKQVKPKVPITREEAIRRILEVMDCVKPELVIPVLEAAIVLCTRFDHVANFEYQNRYQP